MDFRNYDPGLNTFTTRDMYNGALADMNLSINPLTGNRYAIGGSNPTSNVELDGHTSCDETGECGGTYRETPEIQHEESETTESLAASAAASATTIATALDVENSRLKSILGDIYLKPGATPQDDNDGKVGSALIHELETGQPTKGLILRWCAKAREFPPAPNERGLDETTLTEVPGWLHGAYPELFERGHLRERLHFYDMYEELASTHTTISPTCAKRRRTA